MSDQFIKNESKTFVQKSNPVVDQLAQTPHISPLNINDYWNHLEGLPGEALGEIEPAGTIGFRRKYKNGTIYFFSAKYTCAYVTGLIEMFFNGKSQENQAYLPITDSCNTGEGGVACATSDDCILFHWENEGYFKVSNLVNPKLLGVINGENALNDVVDKNIMYCVGVLPLSQPNKHPVRCTGIWTTVPASLSDNMRIDNNRPLTSIPPFGAIFCSAIFHDENVEFQDMDSNLTSTRFTAFQRCIITAMEELASALKQKNRLWFDPALIEESMGLFAAFSIGLPSLVRQAFVHDPAFLGVNISFIKAKELAKLSLKPFRNIPEEEITISVIPLNGDAKTFDVKLFIQKVAK